MQAENSAKTLVTAKWALHLLFLSLGTTLARVTKDHEKILSCAS